MRYMGQMEPMRRPFRRSLGRRTELQHQQIHAQEQEERPGGCTQRHIRLRFRQRVGEGVRGSVHRNRRFRGMRQSRCHQGQRGRIRCMDNLPRCFDRGGFPCKSRSLRIRDLLMRDRCQQSQWSIDWVAARFVNLLSDGGYVRLELAHDCSGLVDLCESVLCNYWQKNRQLATAAPKIPKQAATS